MGHSPSSHRVHSTDDPSEDDPMCEDRRNGNGTTLDRPFPGKQGKNGGKASSIIRSSIQDLLVEKLLNTISLSEDLFSTAEQPEPEEQIESRPFSIPLISSNFRRFSTRIGIVFAFQKKAEGLLRWDTPIHTIAFLAVFTFVCLDPYLIIIIPPIIFLSLFTSAYVKRYPSTFTMAHNSQDLITDYHNNFKGNDKPMTERSKDFFRNMRDIQNIMESYSQLHDQIADHVLPLTRFNDELISLNIFIFFLFGSFFLLSVSHIIPWRWIVLSMGWIITSVNHPVIYYQLLYLSERVILSNKPQIKEIFNSWMAKNVLIDPSDVREVEIFELQHLSSAGEWESLLLSSTPFTPSMQGCVRSERPKGTRFFEDVQPPSGWEWAEKKWTIDLWAREWVEERIITGVEIENEGERWVYDLRYDNEDDENCENSLGSNIKHNWAEIQRLTPNWEEKPETKRGNKKRGDWRRRRLVRNVKRKWESPAI
ncbi:Peroxisomal membrane protein PEX29 [Golovinomyces cichoracearum]|uniref:Peroxisomal membrane protein PEX29 n=1 Tax=Golovinomyces cichoracearum TaxID=62708 RepID=A0A420J2M7_9PEZI|nr:Peroxisomal membrane protein PEX29 [Golovinomyces cichoracearum]